MEQQIENELNNIGADLGLILSLGKAVEACFHEADMLTLRDAQNLTYLLNQHLNNIDIKYQTVIGSLGI